MQVRTYRARSLKEALQMVQHELGPETRIVQTRELRTGWWERFAHGRQFEIRARRPGPQPLPLRRRGASSVNQGPMAKEAQDRDGDEFRQRVRGSLEQVKNEPQPELLPVDRVLTRPAADIGATAWFEVLAELIDAEVPESAARELVESVRRRLDRARLRRRPRNPGASRKVACEATRSPSGTDNG